MSTELPLERQASAIDEIRQMHLDLTEAKATIVDLSRELGQARDRITLLTDERVRLRKESLIYRDNLVELATQQANIGLLADKSRDIMLRVTELLHHVDGVETPEATEAEKVKTAAALAAIDEALTAGPPMETVSKGPLV